jgi:hypothetical protein
MCTLSVLVLALCAVTRSSTSSSVPISDLRAAIKDQGLSCDGVLRLCGDATVYDAKVKQCIPSTHATCGPMPQDVHIFVSENTQVASTLERDIADAAYMCRFEKDSDHFTLTRKHDLLLLRRLNFQVKTCLSCDSNVSVRTTRRLRLLSRLR